MPLFEVNLSNYDYIFFVGHVDKPRNYIEINSYIRAINELVKNNVKILILITEGENLELNIQNCETVHLKTLCSEYMIILMHSLSDIRHKIIHIIDSQLGNLIFEKHGYILSQHNKIFTSQIYEEDTKILNNHEFLTGVFSDNKSYYLKLRELFDLPIEKYHCNYLPVNVGREPNFDKKTKDNFNVLWINTIGPSIAVDMLLKVAETLKYIKRVKFYVFGKFESEYYERIFDNLPNIVYCGEFSDFNSISNENFDCFMYTNARDGIPLIIKEAMLAGLPVITSGYNSIKELIASGKTGFVVPYDDIFGYAWNIITLSGNKVVCNTIAKNAYEVLKLFTFEQFLESLKGVEEYYV